MTAYSVKLSSKPATFTWLSPEKLSLDEAKAVMAEFLRQPVDLVVYL